MVDFHCEINHLLRKCLRCGAFTHAPMRVAARVQRMGISALDNTKIEGHPSLDSAIFVLRPPYLFLPREALDTPVIQGQENPA